MINQEKELISRCQQGDQGAWKEIFERYREKVYRVAYGVVRRREDALDIVQEVFVKLFRSLGDFKGKSNFYTYLYRMAINTAIDHTRKMRKFSASSIDGEGAFHPSDTPEKRPDAILIDHELQEKVKKAMERLADDQRAVLILREVEGLSYQEIAETMGCSLGTVMSRLHYGRRKMQNLLGEYLNKGGKT